MARDVFEHYFGIKDHLSSEETVQEVAENLSNIAVD